MLALAEFLVSEARILETGGEQARKEVKDQIPSERVKDASAMARELRWRLKFASGYTSDDDYSQVMHKWHEGMNGHKRKRMDSGAPELESGSFRNFKPKTWDKVVKKVTEDDTIRTRGKAPGIDDNWREEWTAWNGEGEFEGDEVGVKRYREIVVKVRRTAKGVERQRIERVVEEWRWGDEE